ncbi:putative metal-dependent HD superfamily phosphohydrolase [Mucilaginibacter yixingensis]|uniref:Putative metal-dependent HD superfamily phosphohydrolase n=1 Tax=Mucilaginibacter yixingensis TaxID=1295612 RepID=A0A2T5J5W7_9SPHI|nr:Pycsar system effector family protein [Mucilaginibacter yixingensis]PTQ93557.1 putative metal-dependent HD superfamily phosphohydrolase [Mucilaginibacter yixingensis]
MNYQQLLEEIGEYVRYYYQTHNSDNLIYHNLNHTNDVVDHAVQIANHYQLNDREFFIVIAAAWFHDLGYMTDVKEHETHGANIAEEFLKTHEANAEDIDDVKKCIMATQMPQKPTGLLEEIICDADVYHLGTDDFEKKDKQLRKEVNLLYGLDLSKQEWHKKTIEFLEMHHFHTEYCRLKLTAGKEKNIQMVKDKIAKNEAEAQKEQAKADSKLDQVIDQTSTILPTETDSNTAESTGKKEKKGKRDRPDKGIETMFRISSGNHQRLSDMADNKAHIMITVNSIILSAIISLLLRRLNEYHYLLIPTCILLAISLLAMTFAILSTRPSIPPGTFTRDDVNQKHVNLLFFGNFYKMSLADYTYGMEKMMEDREFLYGSLIRDVYAQGVVLGKKYRLLRISYNIFMFGLIASVLAFVLAAAFNTQVVPA